MNFIRTKNRGVNMSDISFRGGVIASSPELGFKKEIKELIGNYGSISVCTLGRCVKEYKGRANNNMNDAYKLLKTVENKERYIANYIDCGIDKWVEYELKIGGLKGGIDELGYGISLNSAITGNSCEIMGFTKKSDAVRELKYLVEEKKKSGIDWGITYEITGRSTFKVYQAATWKKVRESERELKVVTKQGNVISKEHKYLFFGTAAT